VTAPRRAGLWLLVLSLSLFAQPPQATADDDSASEGDSATEGDSGSANDKPNTAAETPRWASDRGETASKEQLLQLGEDVAERVGAPAGTAVQGSILLERTEHLAGQIRCPVCQGQSVQASTAEAARNMKQQIHAMIAAGYSDDQVLRYFEASYGEFIRMMPRAEGFNLLVWIIPALALLFGLIVTWRVITSLGVKRPEPTRASAPEVPRAAVPADQAAAPETDLDPWLEKVRKELEDTDG